MTAALLKQNLQVLVRFEKKFTRLYRLRFLTFMIPVPYFFICICEHARLHARESTLVTFDLTWNSSAKSQSLARYSVLISWTPAHTIATDLFIKQQIQSVTKIHIYLFLKYVFFGYISGTAWAIKKVIFIYLHPCLKSLQMKK